MKLSTLAQPMDGEAEVSVVVPSYNHASFIERCLRSIFKQTLRPTELIVIDDGSTDGSPLIIERLLERCPFPCELIARPNRGLSATLNEGLTRSRADYFAYLGSDDIWLPGFLGARVALLEFRPRAVLAYGHAYVVDDHDRIIESTVDWAYYASSFQQGPVRITAPLSPTVLYRRNAVARHGWNEAAHLEDYELYLRLSLDGDFVFDPRVLSAWRLHGRNTSRDATLMLNECLNALRRVAPQLGVSDHELEAVHATVKWRSAEDLMRHGSKLQAFALACHNASGAPSAVSIAEMLVRFLEPRRLMQWRQDISRRRASERYGTLRV